MPQKIKSAYPIILTLVAILISACSGSDAPAAAAKEWYVSTTTMNALKADSLVCNAKREEFREQMENGSLLYALGGLLLGDTPEIELDVSQVEFKTTEREGASAVVTAKGEMRGAVGGSIHSEQIDETWAMAEEDGKWKWCGDIGAEGTVGAPPSPAQPTEIDATRSITEEETVVEQSTYEPLANPSSISIYLPGDAISNGNGYIGPFCCTGKTATIFHNGIPVGYIYAFSWEGQAYNVADYSVAPDISILVSGLSSLVDPTSEQIQSSISFLAEELVPGATKLAQAGELVFSATIKDAELELLNDVQHYRMGSVAMVVDVSTSTPGQWELNKNEP